MMYESSCRFSKCRCGNISLAKIGFDTAENEPHRFKKSAELDIRRLTERRPKKDIAEDCQNVRKAKRFTVRVSSRRRIEKT